jgi:acetyl esterase
MRRILAFVLVGLLFGAAVMLWRWTHTPYGRIDLGAALVVHTMPGGVSEFTPEARQRLNGWTKRFIGDPDRSVAIASLSFPGPAGDLPLRVYTPLGEGPFPVVAWIHGGGFWMGDDLPMWDGSCSRLALASGAIVASIGYRLAPEHPFPAAVEDSFAGVRFVAAHAREWRGDADRLAVMGGSAGGNLAAVMALRARDEGGPALRYQVLVVPTLVATPDTESRRQFAAGYGLDGVAEMFGAHVPNEADRRNRWAPLRAGICSCTRDVPPSSSATRAALCGVRAASVTRDAAALTARSGLLLGDDAPRGAAAEAARAFCLPNR